MMSQQAVKLGYANPSELDVDSTVHYANISYPSMVNLLIKVVILASRVGKGLNQLCHKGVQHYSRQRRCSRLSRNVLNRWSERSFWETFKI